MSMWNEDQLTNDLERLGLRTGDSVLVHTSLRKIGKMQSGPDTLFKAIMRVIGQEGTLLVPTFTFTHSDPAGWHNPPISIEALELARQSIPLFNPEQSPTHIEWIGYFPEYVRKQPDAFRSSHPIVSFAALGKNAEFLTRKVPFHFPLGEDSPLARLYKIDGKILLLGVSHKSNSSLHLAEIWANAPYIHRSATLKTSPEVWSIMRGSPECSEGFVKIEPLAQQYRIVKRGVVGDASCQLMSQRQLVSLGISLLQGDSSGLLCDLSDCAWCVSARKLLVHSQGAITIERERI